MKKLITLLLICALSFHVQAQKRKRSTSQKSLLEKTSLSGIKFRSIGPALTSGRIADIAVNPKNNKEYYVATASGGVWKTINSGNTFKPVFDNEGSYSIGCVTIDPNNPNVIWIGTGENNNQRSVAYGDGIYRSNDGGNSWTHMGLKNSEHIGNIIVDPRDSKVIYVSAIGPLWSEGGDRGLYKSEDGGKTWNNILNIDKHTGINEVVMDPRDPDVLYASSFQRRRHVFTYLGGGPGSGLHKSEDGGKTWEKINNGLPNVDLGRIGLAISPANPENIYAIVEAAFNKGGLYISTNRGASWEKRGGYSTSGNYYQEIVADPVDPDKLYAMDTWMKVSVDGGRSFRNVGEDYKHVDNHSLWIDPADTDHLLNGNDGGIYESWDAGKNWSFKANLPVTQFYKVAVDNAKPFYNIYGGTQDNFSLGGPSRTVSNNGPNNHDWFITHGGDGFESQVAPDNPDIVYAQSQYGVLVRYDKRSGEEKGIQPKERKGENAYRWNWDAPLSVSRHNPQRIYFAANKLFKSDDRGNSWQVISDDLTRNIDRNKLEIMGRIWSVDAVAKNRSTSPYGTIVAFSESPLNENLLFVGTDDGLIQITEDGGNTWRKSENFPGVPSRTYVNAVYASKHDENVVYACFNHHKYGNFKPYVYRSNDKGKTWSPIISNLPDRGSVYAIEEDFVDPQLLFVGTEFGAFFSDNGGSEWKQLKAGLPTIAVRDLAIQEEHNDLVLATFGRGFYVLDDYSPLRKIGSRLNEDAILFDVRQGYLFEASYPLGLPGKAFMGDAFYIGDNLGSEVIFSWYLKEGIKTTADQRKDREKKTRKDGGNNNYPSYEELKKETTASKPGLVFTITNSKGEIVRKLFSSASAGVHRMNWDLRSAAKDPVDLSTPAFYNPFGGGSEGALVPPGRYTVSMSRIEGDTETPLSKPVSFDLRPLNNTVLPATDRDALASFQEDINLLSGRVSSVQNALGELRSEMRYIKAAIDKTPKAQAQLLKLYNEIQKDIYEINEGLNGDRVAARLDIGRPPSISQRLGFLVFEQLHSTSNPTQTHIDSYKIAKEEFEPLYSRAKSLLETKVENLRRQLKTAGAPYTPGNLHFLD
ncbi:glycosyl hydrolase [Leptobacterium flavescens]|uniref:Glycosyl hydrolase n=1 Tax=Leptobacterium flavescens TaxID=472055 RepID=A0A6P0UR26_9FLAO|nr:glycosyl hydrolase [Leptobacterium flavescens]NER14960.1 glycosyl hydrolase [Leptobacterium flavescens]